jgi:hypothetical protein
MVERDIRPAILDYENDIDCSAAECLERFTRAVGPEYFPGPPIIRHGGEKQDRNDAYGDKCSNWEEFAEALRQHALYDTAMSPVRLAPFGDDHP